jgi:hypothetical protein
MNPLGQEKTPEQRMDDLYQWLITPATFLMLASWSLTNFEVSLYLGNSTLPGAKQFNATPADLRIGSVLLTYELALLVLSIFLYLAFAWSQSGRLAKLVRFLSFWMLLCSIALLGFLYLDAVPPLLWLPAPGGVTIILTCVITTFTIACLVVRHAYSRTIR